MKNQTPAVLAAMAALACPFQAQATEQDLLNRINLLENRIKSLETKQNRQPVSGSGLSAFNPYISVVLNGTYTHYSRDEKDIIGFQVGEEGEFADKGFSLGESEIMIGANVDDKFSANLTAAIVNEDGEDKIELEEAFIQSIGLPYGLNLTFGRLKPVFGSLNEKHAHTDDFADRPLPYRVFLNSAYKDDGLQLSVVLPTDFYAEIGGGAYRGGYFPAAFEGSGIGAANSYLRVGGDISDNQSWLAGFSYLYAKSAEDGRRTDSLRFEGKDHLYAASLKYSFVPNGNNKESEFVLSGEYLFRNEKGNYIDTDGPAGKFDNKSSGWYAQSTFKFLTNWKIGYRYAQMKPKETPAALEDTILNAEHHKPEMHSVMAEWDNSEFSRIRVQYNRDKTGFKNDNQLIVQYTMSFGAHGAHSY
ncbi:MAG: hypothetical protein IJ752_08305 [Alphaproteobacteria bacterium]|nr:hypothetical protein [Alphaproteobacteria bacterium]